MMKYFLIVAYFLSSFSVLSAEGVKLRGANGVAIEFPGILKATPKGLVLMMALDGEELLVTWDKFDESDMQTRQPDIYNAMQRSIRQREDVSLRLGVYAGMQTAKEFKKSLRDALNQEIQIKLPPMSEFFDDKDIKGGSFNFNHIDDFKFAEKRSARYLKLYTELLQDLVGWENPEFSKSTHSLIKSNGSRDVVVTEARPGRSTTLMKPMDFLQFLSKENNRLSNSGVTLLRYNLEALDAICKAFEDASAALGEGAIIADSSTISNWHYTARSMLESFNSLYKSKTINAQFDRDLRRMFEDFDL
ncbi:MAG TPA: hypothetical protein DCX06_08745 [Opitutae bacterium]|nr:hypothetical protein [Opitutae bacterium]